MPSASLVDEASIEFEMSIATTISDPCTFLLVRVEEPLARGRARITITTATRSNSTPILIHGV